jgi:hypothetical protein
LIPQLATLGCQIFQKFVLFSQAAFQSITGVDPRTTPIRAVVVFNVCEMIHVLRQVLQDFGPFPIIGCDSESLCWLFKNTDSVVTSSSDLPSVGKDSSNEIVGKIFVHSF